MSVIHLISIRSTNKSVKNPNGGEEVSLREPKDILVEINNLDKETNQILDVIKKLL